MAEADACIGCGDRAAVGDATGAGAAEHRDQAEENPRSAFRRDRTTVADRAGEDGNFLDLDAGMRRDPAAAADADAAGKGGNSVNYDALLGDGGKRAGIADAAGEARTRKDLDGLTAGRDLSAVKDAAGEGRHPVDPNADRLACRKRSRIRDAAGETDNVFDQKGAVVSGYRAGIPHAAAEGREGEDVVRPGELRADLDADVARPDLAAVADAAGEAVVDALLVAAGHGSADKDPLPARRDRAAVSYAAAEAR